MTPLAITFALGVASWVGLSVALARLAARAIAIANAEEPPLETHDTGSER